MVGWSDWGTAWVGVRGPFRPPRPELIVPDLQEQSEKMRLIGSGNSWRLHFWGYPARNRRLLRDHGAWTVSPRPGIADQTMRLEIDLVAGEGPLWIVSYVTAVTPGSEKLYIYHTHGSLLFFNRILELLCYLSQWNSKTIRLPIYLLGSIKKQFPGYISRQGYKGI